MADTQKISNELVLECIFLDGDTRIITLKSPRNDVSSTDIEDLESFMQTNNIIIGDKAGSDFRKIKTAIKRTKTTTYLDLE